MDNPEKKTIFGKNLDLNMTHSPITSPLHTIFPTLTKKHFLFQSIKKAKKVQSRESPSISAQKSKQHLSISINNIDPSIQSLGRPAGIYSSLTPSENTNKIFNKTLSTSKKVLSHNKYTRVAISHQTKQQRLSKKEKKSELSSDMDVGNMSKRVNNDMFTPRITKYELMKKSTERIDGYFKKFLSPQKTPKNYLNISTIGQFSNRSQIEQIERLKASLHNGKIELERKVQTIKRKKQIEHLFHIPKKAKIKYKNKQSADQCSPWQHNLRQMEIDDTQPIL